ncbi:MAG: ROK family protein, partial [bacterium]
MQDRGERFVGIDFGATNIRGGLVGSGGRILRRAQTKTHASGGKEEVISRIVELAKELGENSRMVVGVACPGPVDGTKGVLFNPPNLPGWKEVHLKHELEQSLGTTVSVQNDANMVAYGEWRFG